MRFIALMLPAALAGCASSSADIAATYVSPIQYQSYTCPQLSEEAARVSARAAQVAGVQDENASKDKVATTIGIVVFWPALFFTKGNGENAAEVGRLKGTMEAVEQASIQKNCGIAFRRT